MKSQTKAVIGIVGIVAVVLFGYIMVQPPTNGSPPSLTSTTIVFNGVGDRVHYEGSYITWIGLEHQYDSYSICLVFGPVNGPEITAPIHSLFHYEPWGKTFKLVGLEQVWISRRKSDYGFTWVLTIREEAS